MQTVGWLFSESNLYRNLTGILAGVGICAPVSSVPASCSGTVDCVQSVDPQLWMSCGPFLIPNGER